MTRYVVLLRFTETGARQLRQSSTRARAFAKAAREAGVTIETQLWTLGAYDGVLVLSGDATRIQHALANLNALGKVRTETLQAFDAKQFAAITGR